MAKQRSFAEITAEIQSLEKELEGARQAAKEDLEARAKALGYKLVPIGETSAKGKGTTKGVNRDEARKWLGETLKNGPMDKVALQKQYRDHFGNRLRVDGWPDLLATDKSGTRVQLK